MENNDQIEKWYESKLGFLAIVFFPILTGTVIVCLYIGNIQTDIAVQQQSLTDIKDNDLAHIEVEISEIKQSQADESTQIDKVNDQVVKVSTLITTLIKK